MNSQDYEAEMIDDDSYPERDREIDEDNSHYPQYDESDYWWEDEYEALYDRSNPLFSCQALNRYRR